MENKLGQDSAFPRVVINETVDIDGQTTEYNCEGTNGVSKRLYVAKGYADIAYKLADELHRDTCREIIGIDPDVKWDYVTHFPMLVVKFQYMLADEFLKQENNG